MVIRRARVSDLDDMWSIFHHVVVSGDTYAFSPATPKRVSDGYFLGPDVVSWVAELDGRVRGMYKLIPNRRDLGSHVANASFMVHPDAVGRGIGRALGRHCLEQARALGFTAMQFNLVVSTNVRGVALWQSLGFTIVGTLPNAFQHQVHGLVDAYVMYRSLADIVPVFSSPAKGYEVVARDSAYAVIRDQRGWIAVVHAREGIMLPGGGMDDGETPHVAAVREAAEECAMDIEVTRELGTALQYVFSQQKLICFGKRSHFFDALAGEPIAGVRAEHDLQWLSRANAKWALTYESHQWALGI